MIRVTKVLSLLIVTLLATSACTAKDTNDKLPEEITIKSKKMALSIDGLRDDSASMSVFDPSTKIFHLNVKFQPPLGENDVVKVQWWHSPSGYLINTTAITLEKFAHSIDFNLNTADNPPNWPEGPYEAKIYVNGIYKGSSNFEVKKKEKI